MSECLAVDEVGADLRVRLGQPVDRVGMVDAVGELTDVLKGSRAPSVVVDLAGVGRHDHNAIVALREIADLCAGVGRSVEWVNASEGVPEAIESLGTPASAEAAEQRNKPLPLQVGERTVELWTDAKAILNFIGELAYSLYLAVRHPGVVRWGATFSYMDRTGSDAVPIVGMICFLMGLILQMHQFGADIFVADLVGLSICMELGPLMVAMICTGRAGSAFAAEIGTMKVSEEVDALVTMGLDPNRFLVLPKVLALTMAMPMLTLFGDVAGIAGGFAVGMGQLGLPFVAYYQETVAVVTLWHVVQGLIKSVVFALLVAAVGCQRGLRTDGGAQGVGASTTSAVVSGIFLIVLADAGLTIVFNALG